VGPGPWQVQALLRTLTVIEYVKLKFKPRKKIGDMF
jgi:hypothetical protein